MIDFLEYPNLLAGLQTKGRWPLHADPFVETRREKKLELSRSPHFGQADACRAGEGRQLHS
jgi:hypothetical protein